MMVSRKDDTFVNSFKYKYRKLYKDGGSFRIKRPGAKRFVKILNSIAVMQNQSSEVMFMRFGFENKRYPLNNTLITKLMNNAESLYINELEEFSTDSDAQVIKLIRKYNKVEFFTPPSRVKHKAQRWIFQMDS